MDPVREPKPLLLRVPDVARLLDLSERAVYRRIAEGSLPGVRRLGRSVFVSRPELLRWLGQQGGEGD